MQKGPAKLNNQRLQELDPNKFQCHCGETARVWLHLLGLSQKNHQKGVFFDGHDREDVVEDRSNFLDKLQDLDEITVVPGKPLPSVCDDEKPLIRVVHDESTFYANADQSVFWLDGSKQLLKQKSVGQSIMVSDFVVEGHGYLQDETRQARVMLEIQKDGYFNSEKILKQVDTAIDICDRAQQNRPLSGIFQN